MANPWHHALSSVKRWGGKPEDYLPIHQWFDETKVLIADFRHRALRHHAEGIFLCEKIFGVTIILSNGKKIPTRWVGEQHVREDLGFIPAAADWLRQIKPAPWMGRTRKRDVDDLSTIDRGESEGSNDVPPRVSLPVLENASRLQAIKEFEESGEHQCCSPDSGAQLARAA